MTPLFGVWLRAGTPVLEPYPCMCWGEYPCGRRCPCRGRTDVDAVPQHCCARPTEQEVAADARRPTTQK